MKWRSTAPSVLEITLSWALVIFWNFAPCRPRAEGEGFPFPRHRRLTACVTAGCVGHTSVHSDTYSAPLALGSGRVVLNSSSPITIGLL